MTFSRLWYLNADFELELESSAYRRTPTVAARNRRLIAGVLWLAAPGDAVLVEEPLDEALERAAAERGVALVARRSAGDQSHRRFAPWGWSPQAVELGRSLGAVLDHPPLDAVARVNSKRFSHQLEHELGVALPGAKLARTLAELAAAAAVCPAPDDKWVVKSLFGFSARGRVLGRGPSIDAAAATWAAKRFARGEELLFEPWLEVRREYGVQMRIGRGGSVDLLGITDIQTNGAGAVTGYLFGRPPSQERRIALEAIARRVGARLAREGYWGPANVDALEHAGGLRPLLEINARYTLGHVALAVERHLQPTERVFWRLDEGAFPVPR